ncbi:MAG: thiol:disulfide interchange protein DsbA/DsbL [Pseudomonadales bacterium]|jgi:thiol:disulfide interchange protein DsbA|nr:thiol:disulfide interchange protein DsbA/DsbL [Pseudomonadales bacterium]
MAKKDNKVIMARNTIIAFISVVAIGILAFGTYVSTDMGAGEIAEENNDYQVIENPRPRRPGDPIEVIEYFSYACIHCKTFDPIIEEWAAEQPEDIAFSRAPATFSPIWALLSQTYLTFEDQGVLDQNHSRMFRAIHDAGRQFLTPEMVAEYVDGRGLSSAEFLRAFNSPAVKEAMRKAERDQLRFQIAATPSLVVAGKYLVGMNNGQRRALRVVEHLLEQERAAEDTST